MVGGQAVDEDLVAVLAGEAEAAGDRDAAGASQAGLDADELGSGHRGVDHTLVGRDLDDRDKLQVE